MKNRVTGLMLHTDGRMDVQTDTGELIVALLRSIVPFALKIDGSIVFATN
jgi:hypothetical protein